MSIGPRDESAIAKRTRIAECPYIDYCLDDIADRLALRNDPQPRAGLACRKVVAKVVDHCAAIMRNQDSAFCCRTVEQYRIGNSI